jgi:ABC-type hemin transport system ATPase subunit
MKEGRIVLFGIPDEIITCRNLSGLYGARIRVLQAKFPEEPEPEVKVCVPSM